MIDIHSKYSIMFCIGKKETLVERIRYQGKQVICNELGLNEEEKLNTVQLSNLYESDMLSI